MSVGFHVNPSQSFGVSTAIWDHTHSVTCHRTQMNAALHNLSQAGWHSINLPWGMEGWVDM